MRQKSFSVLARVKSFEHGFEGLRDMVATEHNAWIHAFATVLALALTVWLKIEAVEFVIVVLAVVSVWVAEAFNTVLEVMADLVVGSRYSRIVKRAKNIGAGAVLITVLGAVCVGIVILGPPLSERLMN